MKRALIAAVVLVGSALAAAAGTTTYVFQDIARPNGQERSADVREADGRACGLDNDLDVSQNLLAFKKCMLARGWRFSHIERSRTPVAAASGSRACTALVLQVQDTDVGLNHGALAGLTLRVTPPGGRPYVTTVWKEVSMDSPPRRGGTIRVTCDPANPSDIHPID